MSIQHYDQLGRLRLSRQLEDSATESATDETTGIKVQTRYLYSGANSFQLVSNAYRAATSSAAGSEQTMGWTRSKIDVAGRVLEVQTFGGATSPSPWGANSTSTGTVSTTYDANFTTVADQAGKTRRSMVDGLGRLARVDEPDASNNLGSFTSPVQPTTYSYDALGSLVSVNQGVQNRYFMYDSLKRLIRARNPEQGTHSNLNLVDSITGNGSWSIGYEYDANNNLTEKTDARNVVSTYAYDVLNRNTEIDHSDTSVAPDVSRFYDGATNGKGRLWYSLAGGNDLVGDNVEKTLFSSYDALGRPLVLQQRFKLNNAWVPQTYQVIRVYNLAGGVTSQIYPSGNSVTYNYDNAGRLADKDAQSLAFTGNLGGVSRTYSRGISYASGGQLKQEQFGTTTPVYNKLFYNSRQQLAEILASTTGAIDSWNRGKILNQYSLQCSGASCNATDNNGNLRKQEVFIPADDQVSSSTSWYQQYDYDELNRLKRVHEYTGTSSLDWQQEFDYDRWSNRTLNATNTWVGNQNNPPNPLLNEMQCDTGALASTNRIYAPGDLALAENQRRMRYDPAANLINDTYTGAGERFYDAENRMTKAWGGTNQWQYYTYNADGQRTRRKIDNQETWQIYGFDGELLAEYAANGAIAQPQKEYGYRNGQLLITATPGVGPQVQWLVSDHVGTPRMVFDQTGSLANVKRHDYAPFGEELIGLGLRSTTLGYSGGDGVRQQFTSQERDAETGLDYFLARYYSSAQGRFTSVDPANASPIKSDPQSWNGYAHARNNPLLYIDPDGRLFKIKRPDGSEEIVTDEQFNEIKNNPANGVLGVTVKGGKIIHTDENGNQTVVATYERIWFDDLTAQANYMIFGVAARAPAMQKIIYAFAALNLLPAAGIVVADAAAVGAAYLAQQAFARTLTSMSIQQLNALIRGTQKQLLEQLFGYGVQGARVALASGKVPAGLSRESLLVYAEIARRIAGTPKDTLGVHAVRLQIINQALEKMK